MNRLGISVDEACSGLLDGLAVDTLMSHLACADEVGHPMNPAQRDRFAGLLAVAVGTVLDPGECRVDLARELALPIARAQLDRERMDAKIIVGSVRHFMDVNEALEAGAHIPTVPPTILRKMLHNPKTDETIREFNAAWASRGT